MADRSINPAFPLTLKHAAQHLQHMRKNPKPPARPVIVAGGFLDPGVVARNIARRLRALTSPDAPITSISFFWAFTFDACRDRLINHIQQRYPSSNPALTTEVDIIGFSMGGLVARYAAVPRANAPQLNFKRLFTIGTPHRGARMAPIAACDPRARDMKISSPFINQLDQHLPSACYELYPYVRTKDAIVGQHNAAPPGNDPWWVPNKPLSMSHNMAGADQRIIADIARRLRRETPFTVGQPICAQEQIPLATPDAVTL